MMEKKLIPIVIPNLGEGIRDAIVVALLHAPGDAVQENQPILQVESVKSVSEMTATCDGILADWSVKVGDVVPVGCCVGHIRSESTMAGCDGAPQPVDAASGMAEPAGGSSMVRNRHVSPRTRRLLERYDLLGAAESIPRRGESLQPEDVEAYVRARSETETLGRGTTIRSLTTEEVVAIRRLEAGGGVPSPAISMRADLGAVDAAIRALNTPPENAPRLVSELVAWSAARAMTAHHLFRSRVLPGGKCATTLHSIVGIAVSASGALPSIAEICMEDSTSWEEFRTAADRAMDEASQAYRPAGANTTVIVTNMMPFQVHSGVPTLVAPAVAVIDVGEVYLEPVRRQDTIAFRPVFNLGMAFDHRLINGIHAARFLQAIVGYLASLKVDIANDPGPADNRKPDEAAILDMVRHRLAVEVGVNPDLLPVDVPINKMGLDSIMVIEFAIVADKLAAFCENEFGKRYEQLAELSLADIARLACQ